MSASAHHQTPDAATSSRPDAARALRPYAGPAGGLAVSEAAARIAPYIPAAWRRAPEPEVIAPDAPVVSEPLFAARVPTPSVGFAPVMRTPTRVTPIAVRALTPLSNEPVVNEVSDEISTDELPWIDAFLASTPATPMAAITEDMIEDVIAEEVIAQEIVANGPSAEDAIGESILSADAADAPIAEESIEEELVETVVAENVQATDDWPLEDAAADFEDLSHRIDAEHGPEAASLFDAPPAGSHGLAPWTDDDFMDIMPVRRSNRTPLSSPSLDSITWADRARAAQAARDAEPVSGVGRATEAADALELLARRVRAGELAVPEFDSRMGEPAALVAALAAVLGVRLR
ncbi:MAG: hypothetical protein IBJ03_12620 [Gemmatimonadaceae bacterium]|nr:hypothetical protein [Gemmatimonadaceae bacterium]